MRPKVLVQEPGVLAVQWLLLPLTGRFKEAVEPARPLEQRRQLHPEVARYVTPQRCGA